MIPRTDTNPIAHRLLDEFKTIDNIFEATPQALESIPGIGEKAARFIQVLSCSCYMYNKSKAHKKPYVGTFSTLLPFLHGIIPPSDNEQFIALVIGKNYEVKNYKLFKGVSHSFVSFDTKALSEYLMKNKPPYCVLAHTHPNHTALPSQSDRESFYKLAELIKSMSIELLDNLVIGERDFYSFRINTLRKLSLFFIKERQAFLPYTYSLLINQ